MFNLISVWAVVLMGTLVTPIAAPNTHYEAPEKTLHQIVTEKEAKEILLPVTAPKDVKITFASPVITSTPKPKPKPKPVEVKPAPVEEVTAVSETTGDVGTMKKTSSAPPVPIVSPGSAQADALQQLKAKGWGDTEFACLVSLWNRESGWNAAAENPSSGAYGIPQSLPASKMASAGADYLTNASTQIKWGLGYIQERYKTPCGAWGHSESVGWY